MRYLVMSSILLAAMTCDVEAQNCAPIRFVSAAEVPFLRYGPRAVAGLVREADGSFTAHWFETASPYRKRERLPQTEGSFLNGCLGWTRPSFTNPQSRAI